MGIISWIKDKYYDISFQKAKTLIAEGDTDEAIRECKLNCVKLQ